MMEGNIPYQSLLDYISDGVYFVDPKRKILFWNHGAEQITGYSKSEIIGKHCRDNILIHVDEKGTSLCKNMCPIVRVLKKRKVCKTNAFLCHKKGHRIPVLIRTVPVFDNNDNIVGAAELFINNSRALEIKRKLKNLESLALLDPLTGISNRRHLDMVLISKFNRKKRYNWNFGLIFLDIDDFKNVNDSHGHEIGDEVLKMISRNLLHNSRTLDTPGRWGGEEFVIVSDHVDKDELLQIAERIRVLIESSSVHTDRDDIKVTVSAGVTLASSEDTPETLLKRADRFMYESKQANKNCVTLG